MKNVVYEKAIVEKRNVLNELRANNMTLQELRLFSIYLSKINPRDISTRFVRFPLSDFQKIMDLGRINLRNIDERTDSLLTKIVKVPTENGGFEKYQLFTKCRLDRDENGEWFIEINAHDDALPLMFEFKDRYFTYELWNALHLKSPNHIRMYEILKQYEHIGKRELSITELRELLGIAPNEYDRWDNFKRKVLDGSQKALKETTDIYFTYERGKSGYGGKWLTIVFHIFKNQGYVNQISMEEFMDELRQKPVETDTNSLEAKSSATEELDAAIRLETIEAYRQYADPRFTDSGLIAFDAAAKYYYPYDDLESRAIMFNNLQAKMFALAKTEIKNYDSYILKVLENEWKKG